jgi:Ca2+-binding EF-hand superfamily protein
VLAALLLTGTAAAADSVLRFPMGGSAVSLRLDVPDAEPAWAAFLDALFDHFDRDRDGTLSPAEAARVFPLPLPGGKSVAVDFATLDADRDGKASRDEFRAFYRGRGFTPVVVVVEPAPESDRRLGAALFRHLDRDGDGRLSAAELRQAPALLRRLDEDEDEVLTPAELLSVANPSPLPAAGLTITTGNAKSVLRLSPGTPPAVVDGGEHFRLSADGTRLTVPGGACSITASTSDPAAGFRAAKAFYQAQFRAAVGEKPAAKAAFEADPAARVLVELFDAADRDGDGRLTRAELDAFLDLVERGVGCQVVVTVTDCGRNLFDRFDHDADGRLDADELARTGGDLARTAPLTPAAVPASYRLAVGRGPVGDSFGPVPFGTAAGPKPAAPAAPRGPRWFRAMDKNGDGYVSAREFVGPPELFRKLDANGDGRISVGEAEAAGR